MSIYGVLNQIKSGDIVLPAIQRDFVWSEEKVVKLLDSVMRGYPIGIALLWETYEDVQYRRFADNYDGETKHDFEENPRKRKLKIVLDGQQRLQSLYIALYGKMGGRALYFDVLSGHEIDELSDDRYQFRFATAQEARDLNKDTDERTVWFQQVSELFTMKATEQKNLERHLTSKLKLSDADQVRLSVNLARLKEAFSTDENILLATTIDENLPKDSESRKSEADVLEVFVRINKQGTPLSRSDLVFSLLKLNWKEAAKGLPEFVESVNEGNSLGIDNDFVIRCLMAASGLGTRFDLDQLRSKQKIDKLRSNFTRCCNAIRAAADFVVQDCKCQSASLIGGLNTLVPFVFYLFHARNHEIKNSNVGNAKKAFYLLAFAKPLSRYGDSRLWTLIKQEFMPLADQGDETFPYKRIVDRVRQWERVENFDDRLLQSNYQLTLHLLQGLSGAQVQYVGNQPNVDHIFPKSILRERGFEESEINHFANFWILAKSKNLNKSNKPPAEYFADVSDAVLNKALIDRQLLEYRYFRRFLRERSDKLVDRLKRDLHFNESDFQLAAGA